jgi:tetratricopeptide (TPR) repeat protein/DNA-binding XRE family transcriptional regulator
VPDTFCPAQFYEKEIIRHFGWKETDMSQKQQRVPPAIQIKSLGQRLRWHRLRMGLSQEALAEVLGVSARSIRRWEQDLAIPQEVARQRLCQQFGIDARQLLGALPDDETPPVSSPIWYVPFHRNPFFTGREAILQQLSSTLHSRKIATMTQALSGLGGIGKTQTALEYAYHFREHYQALLWVQADTRKLLLASIAALAAVLDLPEQRDSDQHQAVLAVQRWLRSHSQWLLIVDNLEELDLIEEFFPGGMGQILVTTRAHATGPLANRIELAPMSVREGALLLLRRAKLLSPEASLEQASAADRAGAEAIAALLDGLPLALDQAGAYLEETGSSLASYQAHFQRQQYVLLQRRGKVAGSHPASVTTTIVLSCERVAREHPEAIELLRCCAFLHAEAIPEEMLQAGASCLGSTLGPVVADPYQLDLALASLRSASLVMRQPETRTLSVHRLVQAVLRDQMEPAEVRQWGERVIAMVNAAFPKPVFESWPQCERLLAQALACIPLIEQGGGSLPEAGELCTRVGMYLMERGRYKEAEALLAQAVVLGEHQPGLDCSTLIFRLMRQAELSWRQGKYEEAERLLRRAQALGEQHLGPSHPRTAEILNDLALLYCSLEKYGQAELLYQQALDVQEQQLGPRAIETLNTVNNLSLLYWKQGKYEQADPLLQRALHIREQQLGSTHPHTIQSLSNLATLYREQGRYEEAEPLYQQALQTWEQQMGPEHPDTAVMLTNLATLYRHQGKYEEAEPLYQRARCIREQQLGPEHPETAITLANLATLYREQGRYEEAELLYQRALHSWEQQLDPEYSRIATALNDLAILYQNQGKYEEAESLHQRARRMYEQQLEADHPDVAVILNSLATLYQRQGRYEEAEPLYQRALEICERRLGPAHPKTVKMHDSYNCLLEKSNRATETMSDD